MRARGRLGCLLALSGLSLLLLGGAQAAAEPALPTGFQDSIAIGNLQQPTNFRFAADGRVFVALKSGEILVFSSLADTEPDVFADLRTYTYDTGDRGLLGLALDPKFTEGRPYVYALYTYDHILGDPEPAPKWGTPNTTGDPCSKSEMNGGDACLVSGRLVRLEAEGNHAKMEGGVPKQEVLAEGWCQQFSSHSIGDLRFGPEGALFVSGGDGASFTSADYGELGTTKNPCGDPPSPAGTELKPPDAEGGSLRSQNLSKLNGKILRIDPDTGKGLPDNPLSESGDENTQRVIAMGFRNPFRFTFDPTGKEIYTDNVGSSEIEELDRFDAVPGSVYNSGWPCYEGPEEQFQFAPLGLTICKHLYETPGSTSDPLFYYSHGQSVVPEDECPIEYGSALGGISFYDGESYPSAYKGALFFSDAVRGCVWVMFPGADGKPDPHSVMRFLRESRIYPAVDIEQGPEGDLYYADLFGNESSGAGAIHRISYKPGAPTARLTANPPYGTVLPLVPLKVTLNASKSSDPDSEPLTYDWDLNGDGTFETENGGETQTVEYTKKEMEEAEKHEESRNRVAAVRVEDGDGHTSVARVTIYPEDKPPAVQLERPFPTDEWGVGDKIELKGFATDGDENPIYTPLSYYWNTGILHCPTDPNHCHTHPLQTFAGVRTGQFEAPEHDYPSYIEVTLSVADARGLSATKTVKLNPRTVNLTIGSSPAGIELTAGLLQGLSPLSLTAIEGSHVLLSAPATAQVGGQTYTWQSWSDGGERIHTVTADASRTITAAYIGPPTVEQPKAEAPIGGPPKSEPPRRKGVPTVVLRKHPSKETAQTVATFKFSSGEAGAVFRCKLDKKPYKSCRSPLTYRKLKQGKHVFNVVAVSSDGARTSSPAVFRWKVR